MSLGGGRSSSASSVDGVGGTSSAAESGGGARRQNFGEDAPSKLGSGGFDVRRKEAIGDEVGEFMPHPIVSAPVVGLRSCRMLGKGDPPLPAGEAGSDMGDSGSDGSATSDAMRCRPSDATQ